MMNRSGPSTEPWGTPEITRIQCENFPLITTLCILSFNQPSIHFTVFSSIPSALTLIKSLFIGTLSKALENPNITYQYSDQSQRYL